MATAAAARDAATTLPNLFPTTRGLIADASVSDDVSSTPYGPATCGKGQRELNCRSRRSPSFLAHKHLPFSVFFLLFFPFFSFSRATEAQAVASSMAAAAPRASPTRTSVTDRARRPASIQASRMWSGRSDDEGSESGSGRKRCVTTSNHSYPLFTNNGH